MPPKLPTNKLSVLQRWANIISGHYFAHVYLVGSALKTELYRDVDIVIVLSDENFKLRYQIADSVEEWILRYQTGTYDISNWRWVGDCQKKWKNGCQYTGLSIDFKVVPKSYFIPGWTDQPMFQLDEMIEV